MWVTSNVHVGNGNCYQGGADNLETTITIGPRLIGNMEMHLRLINASL